MPHGICEHNPEDGPHAEYVAEWPGLISAGDYALMMARFEETAQPWATGLANGRRYLLSGITRCGGQHAGHVCGAAMYGQARKRESGTTQRRYRCKGLDNFLREVGCGKVFRDAVALDEFVTDAVLARFDAPDIARALTSQDEAPAVDGCIALPAFNRNDRLGAWSDEKSVVGSVIAGPVASDARQHQRRPDSRASCRSPGTKC